MISDCAEGLKQAFNRIYQTNCIGLNISHVTYGQPSKILIFNVHSLSVGMKIKLVKSVKIYYSANLAFHLSQGFKIETYDDIETAWL